MQYRGRRASDPISAVRNWCSDVEHLRHIVVNGKIVWAPALRGGCVLTTRGSDYELHIGEDLSIGYPNRTDTTGRPYLCETFTFLMLTSEASVPVKLFTAGMQQPRQHLQDESLNG